MGQPTSFIQDSLRMLLEEHEPPCLSLYLPTHRRHPENQQDPIRYKNLLKTLEESLLSHYPAEKTDTRLESFQALAGDTDFWNHTWDGLAVLGAADLFRVVKLQRPVSELAVAADSFHVKPLLRILQSADRYQVLSLNRREIKLFEGNRDHLDEMELVAGVPGTITEALGDELTEPHQTVTSHGGRSLGSSMRHGHGAKTDEVEIDEERFFRAVDRAILEHYSRPSGLPLIVATLGQYHTPFRQVSRNPFLVDSGIEVDAGSLTIDQLRQRAWAIVEPGFRSRVRKLSERFEEARSKGLGADDLEKVALAAAQSRVESLLVEADRRIPGHLDQQAGGVIFSRMDDLQVDDLLDDLAELVLKRGGQVVVVPASDMPTTAGAAAIFRY
ncbi:MAG: hypothetical protein IPM24_25640 [Bryobacterales bacterium]|nr:hypothetical protein [Bryobacterales bacterium]